MTNFTYRPPATPPAVKLFIMSMVEGSWWKLLDDTAFFGVSVNAWVVLIRTNPPI